MAGNSSCSSIGQHCTGRSDCCSPLQCDSQTKLCANQCIAAGQPCSYPAKGNVKCCSPNFCTLSSVCGTCASSGDDCDSDDECCSEQCSKTTHTCIGAPTNSPSKTPVAATNSPSKAPIIKTSHPTLRTQSPSFSPTSSPSEAPVIKTSRPTLRTQSPSFSPTSSPSGFPTILPTFQPTPIPTALPSQVPTFTVVIPRNNLAQSPITIPGSATMITAFLTVAALFLFVRRRNRSILNKTMEEVRRNRRFASRKSISEFMAGLQKDKEEILIDPERLDLGRVIGMGSHGIVYQGLYLGDEVAVKELVLEDDENDAKESRKRFLHEMLALRRLRHPNIIKLVGVGALKAEDELGQTFFFVMELAKCSLRDVMNDGGLRAAISTLRASLDISLQVVQGLAYMHHMKLLHLDVKPENILISQDGHAKLCDLGLSEVALTLPPELQKRVAKGGLPPPADPTKQQLQGTSPYIAPELVADYRKSAPRFPVSFTVDVYSFGIVFWEILHAPMPSHPLNWDPYRILVEAKYNNYRPKIDPAIPEPIGEMIKACWSEDPAKRPDLHEMAAEIGVWMDTYKNVRPHEVSLAVVDELVATRHRELSRSAML